MLRVLILAGLFPQTGRPLLGRMVGLQAVALAARPEVEVRVVAPARLPPFPLSLRPKYRETRTIPPQDAWRGVTVYRPHYTTFPKLPRFNAAAMARPLEMLLKEIRGEFPFDILHADLFWPDGPAAMRVARQLGVPFTIKARGHDIYVSAQRASIRRQMVEAAYSAARLLAVSATLKDAMVRIGMPEDRIDVHYTGLDHMLFRPRDRNEAKAALGVKGPLLLVAGNILPRKGQMIALEALRSIGDATLMVAGGGPAVFALANKVKELGLEGRVRMLGWLPQEEMPALYTAADVTILPTSVEGLANAWVESIACGTPVVTTDVSGASEVIDRPECGRIVARDPAAFVDAIREMLAAPPSPEAVAAAAQRFSWEKNAEQLEHHLRAAAGPAR